jgi:hypothetical protein
MHQIPGRIDEPRHLLLVEYSRQSPLTLGKWNVIEKLRPAQRLDEEKTQRRSAAFDGSGRKLALAKQICLVLVDNFSNRRVRTRSHGGVAGVGR